jgi:hypothetical protein
MAMVARKRPKAPQMNTDACTQVKAREAGEASLA